MFIKPLVASITALATLAVAASNASICNGHAELCDRKYSNVTFIGSHDSVFVGNTTSDNQHIPLAEQLALGVRFLQAQTHDDRKGNIELCHSDCMLRDAGPLEELLKPIKTFLDLMPTEIITLLITNPSGFNASAFDDVFKRVGLDRYALSPGGKLTVHDWPTLGEMIAHGKRLVVFMDFPVNNSVPYILDEFDNTIIETPYEYDNMSDLTDCPIDRPHNGTGGHQNEGMLLVNHWLQQNVSGILIPDRCNAIITNSEKFINGHVQSCQRTLEKTPVLVLLDWINVGDAMRVQDVMNGLSPRTMKQDTMLALKLAGCTNYPEDPDDPEGPNDPDDLDDPEDPNDPGDPDDPEDPDDPPGAEDPEDSEDPDNPGILVKMV